MELDVSYKALLRELELHNPNVKIEFFNYLLDARSRKNSARSSSEVDSQSSLRETEP